MQGGSAADVPVPEQAQSDGSGLRMKPRGPGSAGTAQTATKPASGTANAINKVKEQLIHSYSFICVVRVPSGMEPECPTAMILP